MAAIDKCYIDNYQDYIQLKNWMNGRSFITPRGRKITLNNYLFSWEEKDFLDENNNPISLPVFNTPYFVDNYLYNNCPLSFIQAWLKDRYFIDGYRKGCPEDVQKELKLPEYEPCKRVKIIRKGLGNLPYKVYNDYTNKKYGIWWVDVKDNINYNFYKYNEDYDYWLLPDEKDVWTSSTCSTKLSIKAIIRKILRKWKLPKGCTIIITGRLIGDEWILKTF